MLSNGFPWLERWQPDRTFHPSHWFSEQATKSDKLNVQAQTDICQRLTSTIHWWMWLPWHGGVMVNDQAETGGQNNYHTRLGFLKMWSVKELETLSAGTKPKASHHTLIAWRRDWHRQRKHLTISQKGWERAITKMRSTLELFHRQHWGLICETWWSAHQLSAAEKHRIELKWN